MIRLVFSLWMLGAGTIAWAILEHQREWEKGLRDEIKRRNASNHNSCRRYPDYFYRLGSNS